MMWLQYWQMDRNGRCNYDVATILANGFKWQM